jgi:hypothetical protein
MDSFVKQTISKSTKLSSSVGFSKMDSLVCLERKFYNAWSAKRAIVVSQILPPLFKKVNISFYECIWITIFVLINTCKSVSIPFSWHPVICCSRFFNSPPPPSHQTACNLHSQSCLSCYSDTFCHVVFPYFTVYGIAACYQLWWFF